MTAACRVLAAALLAAGCGAGPEGPVAGEEFAEMSADQVMFDIEHHVTVDGLRRGVLVADTAYIHPDSSRVEVRVFRLTLFNDAGDETAIVTARSGQLDTRTEAMVARGGVVLVTIGAGQRVETEELHFDPGADRIWSDVETTMYEDGSIIHGDGFTADSKLTHLRVRRPSGLLEGVRIIEF